MEAREQMRVLEEEKYIDMRRRMCEDCVCVRDGYEVREMNRT